MREQVDGSAKGPSVSDRVWTPPNVLSMLRLVGVPLFLWLILRHHDGWAVVVDRGEQPSWLLTMTGVSEDAARAISADLVPVEG